MFLPNHPEMLPGCFLEYHTSNHPEIMLRSIKGIIISPSWDDRDDSKPSISIPEIILKSSVNILEIIIIFPCDYREENLDSMIYKRQDHREMSG